MRRPAFAAPVLARHEEDGTIRLKGEHRREESGLERLAGLSERVPRHARIVVDRERRRVVEDLNSKNGTLVGGNAVQRPTDILDGDDVTFGSVDVKLRSWGRDTDAETKRISRRGTQPPSDSQTVTGSGSES